MTLDPPAGPQSAPPVTAPASPGPTAPAPAGNGTEGAGTSETDPIPTKKWKWAVFIIVLVVIIALVIAFFDGVRHWIALHTGTLHGGPDLYYNFWSGFGADLGEATLISAVGLGVYTGVRKVNCHTKGCWRIGHHQLEGTPYILCRHHHPSVPTKGASHGHILEQHRKYKEAQAAKGA
ncbi:MAG: hypothetical protein ACLP9C_07160 [Acidimicrobiales bacterium]